MNHRKAWRWILAWLPVVLWYALIFWFSAQPGEVSEGQSGQLSGIIGTDWDWFPIRKQAHMGLFAVLGALSCLAGRSSGWKGRRLGGMTLGICALLGAFDEVHQVFVAGRTAQVGDVAIDTLGALVGMLLCMAVARLWTRRRSGKG